MNFQGQMSDFEKVLKKYNKILKSAQAEIKKVYRKTIQILKNI